MKSVFVGIVAAVAIAFAAHAAYNNFAAGNNKNQSQAAKAAQPSLADHAAALPSASDNAALAATADETASASALQSAAKPMIAAAPTRPAAKPANRPAAPTNVVVVDNNPAPQPRPVLQNPAPAPTPAPAAKEQQKEQPNDKKADTPRSTESDGDDLDNSDSVDGYEFAFVDPQFIGAPFNSVRAAEEQSVQDVLSPSAP